ncbi:hypothetical protein DESC_460028 [Desulfosarcina cetonica]|nr:hypothetical protein DESC_460028 [Desulfosarcina cetonica]
MGWNIKNWTKSCAKTQMSNNYFNNRRLMRTFRERSDLRWTPLRTELPID